MHCIGLLLTDVWDPFNYAILPSSGSWNFLKSSSYNSSHGARSYTWLGKVHEGKGGGNAGMTSPPPFANQLLLPPPFSFGGGGTTRKKGGEKKTRGWRGGGINVGLERV